MKYIVVHIRFAFVYWLQSLCDVIQVYNFAVFGQIGRVAALPRVTHFFLPLKKTILP